MGDSHGVTHFLSHGACAVFNSKGVTRQSPNAIRPGTTSSTNLHQSGSNQGYRNYTGKWMRTRLCLELVTLTEDWEIQTIQRNRGRLSMVGGGCGLLMAKMSLSSQAGRTSWMLIRCLPSQKAEIFVPLYCCRISKFFSWWVSIFHWPPFIALIAVLTAAVLHSWPQRDKQGELHFESRGLLQTGQGRGFCYPQTISCDL
jgi:hypothetical protein